MYKIIKMVQFNYIQFSHASNMKNTKLRYPTNLANISHQKKIVNLVLKKNKSFLKSDNCLILRLQLQLNCQQIYCLHEIKINRETSLISTDWSGQSISIKSDLPIFINWLLQVFLPIGLQIPPFPGYQTFLSLHTE